MSVDVAQLGRLIKYIRKDITREEIRSEWLALLPAMSMQFIKTIEWEEYYNRATGADIDLRPSSDILAEVEEVRKYV